MPVSIPRRRNASPSCVSCVFCWPGASVATECVRPLVDTKESVTASDSTSFRNMTCVVEHREVDSTVRSIDCAGQRRVVRGGGSCGGEIMDVAILSPSFHAPWRALASGRCCWSFRLPVDAAAAASARTVPEGFNATKKNSMVTNKESIARGKLAGGEVSSGLRCAAGSVGVAWHFLGSYNRAQRPPD